MKSYQIYVEFSKRMLSLLLVGCIVFSVTFFDYRNMMVVNAEDGYDQIIETAVIAGLSVLGVIATGGTSAAIATILLNAAGLEGINLYHYFKDNGDGTTTISEEFIQLVSQAYQQYKEENADLFDGSMNMTQEGYYYFPSCEVTIYNPKYSATGGLAGTVRFTDIYSYFPCAIYLKHDNDDAVPFIVYYDFTNNKFYSYSASLLNDNEIISPSSFSTINPKYCTRIYVDVQTSQTYFNSFGIGIMVRDGGVNSSITANSSSIPVYHDLNALKQGLKTEDFSAAFNYGTIPDMESSKYTGFYEGGDITVTNEKLAGISDKLDEINGTEKDIDSKLQDLLDWLGIGGDSSSIGGITGWLEKIYNKLVDIFQQLKSIKRWTVVDTIIDGADAIADWLDLIHDIISDADNGMESAVATLSSALDDSAGLLKKKFPFSVPWDILAFVTLFAAEPEVPRFEVPIDISVSALDMNIHYDFVVDFSSYQYLSDIFRAVLSLTYAVGLLKMTAGIASTKKEE